jgi:TonB family protein
VVVVGQASSSKSALTGAVTIAEPDPVKTTEYISASPEDGIIDYKEYIDSTLTYPADAGSGDREVVVVKFSVTPDGRPSDIRVIRSPGDAFSREANRVITEGPDWRPATRDGIYVDDGVRLRIVFRPASQ